MAKNVLSKKDALELIKEWKEHHSKEDFKARNKVGYRLAQAVEGWIYRMISYYCKSGHVQQADRDEIYNEAMGMVATKAPEKFDIEKAEASGASWNTYCTFWIRHTILRHLNKGTLVRVPVNKRAEAMKKLARQEELSDEEWAYVPNIVYWDKEVTSKDSSTNDLTLMDVLESSESIQKPVNIKDVVADSDRVTKLLKAVDERELKVIRGLYLKQETMQNIGKELNLSRQRIDQIHRSALRKMRLEARRENISW